MNYNHHRPGLKARAAHLALALSSAAAVLTLCAALRGAGAKVVVIDDGRSFEHSVKLQGGRFVEFTLASSPGWS